MLHQKRRYKVADHGLLVDSGSQAFYSNTQVNIWADDIGLPKALHELLCALEVSAFELVDRSNNCVKIGLKESIDWCRDKFSKISSGPINYLLIDQKAPIEKPKLLVFDMDSTLIQIECIDEIARKHGLFARVAEITERAMRGELDFAQSLIERVGLLKGLSNQALLALAQDLPLTQGAELIVQWAKQHHCKIAVVSGGFLPFVHAIQRKLQLDYATANELEVIDGHLSGKLVGQIVDAQEKRERLLALQTELNLSSQQIWAIGDGANDILMLNAAGLGVAFCAKPAVQKQANAAINNGDLASLLDFINGL